MKCIWRILLGVLTAGLSEVLRHKNHDKSLPCPDNFSGAISLGDLNVGDMFMYHGLLYVVDEKNNDYVKFHHYFTGHVVELGYDVIVKQIK